MNINEIAKLANVSRATVSRYFNDGYVSAEKREQIRRVIEETGYKPSAQAQMLRTKKTKQIGVIIPKINSESISGMVSGISKELKQAGFWLLLANTENQEREEVEYLKLFSENQVDGIILIGTIFTPAHKRALRALQVPVVVLGQKLEGYSCVYQDDYLAAKESARMMLKDAKHPACLGVTKRDHAAGEERFRGFLDVLEEKGIDWDNSFYEESAFSVEDGYEAMGRLWERHPEIDAVFGATDSVALGALGWLQEHQIRIPQQVAISGVGDTVSGQIVAPKLSSVHFFYQTSGQEAARLLLELMNGNPAGKEIKMGFRTEERGTTRQTAIWKNLRIVLEKLPQFLRELFLLCRYACTQKEKARNSNERNKNKTICNTAKIKLEALADRAGDPPRIMCPAGGGPGRARTACRCSRHCSSTWCLRARSVGLQRSLRHRNDPCAGSTASGRTVFHRDRNCFDVSCGWQRLCDSGQRLYDDRLSNPGHSIADRTGVADLERNFMDPQQGWRKEKSRQRRAGT